MANSTEGECCLAEKILVFGDVGIDDTIALIYSYLNDQIDIVGIVADYGNISRENALANVHYVKNLLNVSENIKIYAGAEVPTHGRKPTYFPEIHGEYGLGPITPPVVTNESVNENFYEVVEIIEKYGDELIIVNIGRLTSLATMFILYQNLMNKVKAYYLMGGAFWVPGNATAVSEANFYADPNAANIVLTYANNVTIIPLNVTEQAIVTPEMVNYIDERGQVELVKPLLDYYYDFYKKRNPSIQGSPMHDALTLMATIHEKMLIYRTLPVTIVESIDSEARGQSIADIRPYENIKEKQGKQHRIAFQLDYRQFFNEFMTVMTKEVVG